MDTAPVSSPLPPLVPGLPLIGNAPALAKDIIGFVVEQYQQFGPIFRVRALKEEMVVLAGPEANIFVTQEGADTFLHKARLEAVHPGAKVRIKVDPTPTLGKGFRIRIVERLHQIATGSGGEQPIFEMEDDTELSER